MEWYHGSSYDDFEVPRDQEVSDRLPSPQSWLKWGETTPEKLDLQNKCFIHDAQLTCGGFNFNCKVFNNEVEMESCVHDEDRSEECYEQTGLSHYQPDYQLDGLGECEQMDDIFLYERNLWNFDLMHVGNHLVQMCMVGHPMEVECCNACGWVFFNPLTRLVHHRAQLLSEQKMQSLCAAMSNQQTYSNIHGMTNSRCMSSLLEDIPETENFHKSFHCSPELQSGVMSSRSEILDSKSSSSDAHNRGSSKYLKTHAFSPSVGMGKAKVASPQFTPCTGELDDWSEINEPPMSILDYPEDDSSNTFFDEETTLEECVLLELEMVITQLTDKTRMCFRDALYRLANNSGHHSVMPDQGEGVSIEYPPWTCAEDQIRSEGQNKTELKTNTIDRAVANMMFNKMESSDQTFTEEATGPQSCSMDHEQIQHLPHYATPRGDAEVPILDQMYLQTRTNPSELMLRNPVENRMCLG